MPRLPRSIRNTLHRVAADRTGSGTLGRAGSARDDDVGLRASR